MKILVNSLMKCFSIKDLEAIRQSLHTISSSNQLPSSKQLPPVFPSLPCAPSFRIEKEIIHSSDFLFKHNKTTLSE